MDMRMRGDALSDSLKEDRDALTDNSEIYNLYEWSKSFGESKYFIVKNTLVDILLTFNVHFFTIWEGF